MPTLEQIATAFNQYRRYGAMDIFVDDIDEFSDRSILTCASLVRRPPRPAWQLATGDSLLTATLHPELGIVQVRRPGKRPPAFAPKELSTPDLLATDAILAQSLETAASEKEGLLAGVVLAMLVGSHVGTLAGPVGQRVLALEYDGTINQWRVYDGPMLPWVRQHLALESQ